MCVCSLVDDLRAEQDALRLTTENCEQDVRQLKEKIAQHEVNLYGQFNSGVYTMVCVYMDHTIM